MNFSLSANMSGFAQTVTIYKLPCCNKYGNNVIFCGDIIIYQQCHEMLP